MRIARYIRACVTLLGLCLSVSALAQSDFAGKWEARIIPKTGKHSITVIIVVEGEKISGQVTLRDTYGTEIESPLLNPELDGRTLKFESKQDDATFSWKLTLKKEGGEGFLEGSMGHMGIEERVVKNPDQRASQGGLRCAAESEESVRNDYEIYSAVLNQELGQFKNRQTAVLSETSIAMPPGSGVAAQLGDKNPGFVGAYTHDLQEAFETANEVPSQLDVSELSCPAECVLVTPQQLKQLFRKDVPLGHLDDDPGWNAFYKRFPQSHGITFLSHVAYNPSRDRAIVYIGTMSGMLSGHGELYIFYKDRDAWKIQTHQLTWFISSGVISSE